MPMLEPHPVGACAAVTAMAAEALRPAPALLQLRYRLIGDLDSLALPPPAPPARTDGLWRHTCFEAFVRPAGADAYVELNLAPSTAWAAYGFDRYREGMRAAPIAPVDVEVVRTNGALELSALIDLSAAGLPLEAPWRVGLSAVIEAKRGDISYWALAHPPGRPDFHSPDCLALELPAPQRP